MNYFDELNRLIDEIMFNELLIKRMIDVKLGLNPSQIEASLRDKSIQVDDSIKAFYQSCGGLSIRWRVNPTSGKIKYAKETPELIVGKSNIIGFPKIFGTESERTWSEVLDPFGLAKKLSKSKLERFYPFDLLEGQWVSGFLREENCIQDSLWLFSIGDQTMQQLGITISEYIKILISCKAFSFWPLALADKRSEENSKLIRYLPQVFPGSRSELNLFE